MIQFGVKAATSLAIIVICAQIGRRFPSLGGLIATMPLTSLIVLIWLRSDGAAPPTLDRYVTGVLWGIIPTVLFFGAVLAGLRRGLPFPLVMAGALTAWLAGAAIHQAFLR